MKQKMIRFALATAVFLAGSSAAFAQTAPSTAPLHAVAAPAMTPGQIAIAHHRLPKSFTTETAALAHCKTTVIWANPKAKIYYTQASAGFGKAQPGVYACVRDAIKAGFKTAV